jgi:hypothetical protein
MIYPLQTLDPPCAGLGLQLRQQLLHVRVRSSHALRGAVGLAGGGLGVTVFVNVR